MFPVIKKSRHGIHKMTTIPTLAYDSHKVKKYLLYHEILHTHLIKYSVTFITKLNNYNGFTNLGKHV